MVSGISTAFLPENLFDLCDMLTLSLQEKQAGNISDIINEELVAIVKKNYKNTNAYLQNNIIFC